MVVNSNFCFSSSGRKSLEDFPKALNRGSNELSKIRAEVMKGLGLEGACDCL